MKRIVFGILILIVIIFGCIEISKYRFGYFVNVPIPKELDGNSYITSIYKEQDVYAFIINGNKIYKFNLLENFEFSINNESPIEIPVSAICSINKQGSTVFKKFSQSIVGNKILGKGQILFYEINPKGKFLVYLFDLNLNKIVSKYVSKDNLKAKYEPYVFTTANNEIYFISKNINSNKLDLEKFNPVESTLSIVKSSLNSVNYPEEFSSVALSNDNTLLIRKVKANQTTLEAYLFNSKLNQLSSVDWFKNDLTTKKQFVDFKIVPLDLGKFVLVSYKKNIESGMNEDLVTVYQYKKGYLETLSSFFVDTLNSKYFLNNYSITSANISPLNDNELLVTGGMAGQMLGMTSVKNAYLIDLNNKKVLKIKDMKYPMSSHKSIVINKDLALIYVSDYNSVDNINLVQGFKRSRVW